MKHVTATAFSFAAIAALAGTALADGDIGLRLVNNQIQTVEVEGEPPSQIFGTTEERVFKAEFDWNITFPSLVAIDEPGYASNDSALLGQSVRVFLRGPTRKWTGSTFETETTFTLATGKPDLGVPFVTLPSTGTLAADAFNITDDFHFDWTLNNATDTLGQGIYLAEIELRPDAGQSFLSSKPLWIVFGYGATTSDLELAKGYVESVLVPAPGAAAGLVLAGVVLAGRRRR